MGTDRPGRPDDPGQNGSEDPPCSAGDDMREFLRIAGINVYTTCCRKNLTAELLKGALSLDAVLGTNSWARRSNNSVFTALHRMSGNTGTGSWRHARFRPVAWAQ